MTRMTSERFFGGSEEKIDVLQSILEWIATNEPNKSELIDWIRQNTRATSEEGIRRNINFLESIELINLSSQQVAVTNKGDACWRYDEPLVIYQGLSTGIDGFTEMLRSVNSGDRTIEAIQMNLHQAFPEYELPVEVINKHLDWLRALELVEERNSEFYVSIEYAQFDIGEIYNRWFIHDVFKGERYRGIATPSDHPYIFIFTGESGETYGYEDEFLDDDSFLYTGEGTEGDMVMERGNRAIRDHQENGDEIHLFESTELPWTVTYLGEYELTEVQTTDLEDRSGDVRTGFRFRLSPVEGTEIESQSPPTQLSIEELYQAGSSSSSSQQTTTTTTRTRTTYRRSAYVKEFAHRMAEGVCIGCENEAPFEDKHGEPFLEVHHLTRMTDGGPDKPENVVAICPNCHRRVHQGQDGKAFNQQLKEKTCERYSDVVN